jgi:hypothetical protein
MSKLFNYIKDWLVPLAGMVFLIGAIIWMISEHNNKPTEALKDYKDGIQNHLIWSIKGECFFVRPHTDVTVYLVRVADCDKK